MSRYPILCRHCGAPIEREYDEPETVRWVHVQNGERYERCLPSWSDAPTMRAEPET